MGKAFIHYYTGTGNSFHAAKVLAKELKKLKWKSEIIRIKAKMNNKNLTADLHVFIYPVYAFSCPYGFIKYLKSLKNGNNSKAAVIANHGMINLKGGINTGYEGNGPSVAAKILKKKSFDVFYTGAIGYPENITLIADAIPDKNADEIIKSSDDKIKNIAKNLSEFKTSIKKYNFLESILSMAFGMLLNNWGRWHIGKMYSTDKDCNVCRICVKNCPANCIKIFNKKPRWNWKCQACFGCFNICPKKSINISIVRAALLFLIGFVDLGFMIMYYSDFFNLIINYIPLSLFFKSSSFFILSSIIVYIILYLTSIYLLDKSIFFIEQIPVIRNIFFFTYSKNLKRYVAFDFISGK